MHGHTYEVIVTLKGDKLDKAGMVLDFAGLDLVVECFLKQLDHQVLNHVHGLEENPTAETIAAWLGEQLRNAMAEVVSVRVYENPDMWAEWS